MLDALLDTLKLAPLLLIVHVLIEVFEYHTAGKLKFSRLLSGRLAPLIGGTVGVIPQCGFSVVAANLYAKRHIRLGTLLAVFIATSDEAIPILLSDVSAMPKLLPLIGFKLLFAVTVGYGVNFFMRRKSLIALHPEEKEPVIEGCHGHQIGAHSHEHDLVADAAHDEAKDSMHTTEANPKPSQANRMLQSACDEAKSEPKKKKKFDFQCFVVHPLIHTLTVLAFILGVNLVLGFVLYFVGEARLEAFLMSARWAQPFLAGLVGLIPNCASSVVITQLYAGNALTLGAAFAGLSVNAGLGLAVLIKENKNAKENGLIVLGMYVSSCAVGLLLTLLPL